MKKTPDSSQIKSDFPPDNILTVLPELLDAGIAKTLLADHFEKTGKSVSGCRISYIRYKPRTNCIIVYRVDFNDRLSCGGSELPVYAKLFSVEEFKTASEKARRHRWANFCDMGEYLLLPDYRAIIYFFPNDALIDGLRMVENPKKIQRILYQYHPDYKSETWRISDRKLKFEIMRYKPERRAVIRFDTRAVRHADGLREKLSVFARIYADGSGRRVFDLQKELHRLSLDEGRFDIPEPLAYLPDRRLFLMKNLEGKQLLDQLKEGHTSALQTTANALASLHKINPDLLPALAMSEPAEEIRASFEMISEITPELSKSAEDIHDSLLRLIDRYPSRDDRFVHGDFYYAQVIINHNVAGIIDFDRSCAGDPTTDIGNFLAQLKLLSLKGVINNKDIESSFIQAYEKAAGVRLDPGLIAFRTAFSLYLLAVSPFRGLEPDWRRMTELILKECLNLLP